MRARRRVTAAAFTPVTPAEPVPGGAAGWEVLVRWGGHWERVHRGRASSTILLLISHGAGAPSP